MERQNYRKIDYLNTLQKNGIRERQKNEIGKIELWNNGSQELCNSGKTGLQIDKIAVSQDYRKRDNGKTDL